MFRKLTTKLYIIITLVFCCSCTAFMHGYTWSKAENSYNLVTGNKDAFGDKRLRYIQGFHTNSQLSNFLQCNCRGLPSFIYEYKTVKGQRGVRLFYSNVDSVFIFEEPAKGKLRSVLVQKRNMDNYERETYERLKQGQSL